MSGTRPGRVLLAAFTSVAITSAASICIAQAGAGGRAEFMAFLDKVTKAHAQYFRGQPEPCAPRKREG
jgi:hypothetical protein